MPAQALAVQTAAQAAAAAADFAEPGPVGRQRLAGGGPAGRSPLLRALRAKGPDLRRAASGWHDRFERDRHAAIAELVSLVLTIADVPSHADIAREDVEDHEPADVVQQLVASLALEASEKGADFTQHWLVSRERGAQRIRENYPVLWRELASTASCESLLGGLWQLLRDWCVALSECQFRSIRHCATVAVLHLVEGMGTQCASLREFCGTAAVQLQHAEAQGAARLPTLSNEHAKAQKTVELLAAARDTAGVALLSRRTKDCDAEIRRSCFEAFRRWVTTDSEAFLAQQWTRYLHFSLNDQEPKVRAAGLAVLDELLKEPALPQAPVRELIEHICARVVARCHDKDEHVGAAAIRCATQIATRGLLGDDDFDPIIDLVWHPEAGRRTEAVSFVSKHVLAEDIMDYPANGASGGSLLPANDCGLSRRRVTMLLEFLGDYTQGHYSLADRLVASLWKRASCLEDWEALASLALPGGEHALSGHIHTALIYLAEATVRLAFQDATSGKPDDAARAEAVLDRAARALAGRLPAFFTSCQAEPVAMRRAASLFRCIFGHCSTRRSQGASFCDGILAGAQGEAAADALKGAFMRQPDPDTLEFVAEAFAYLMDLSDRARPVVLDIAGFLHEKMMKLIPQLTLEAADAGDVPVSDALLAVATRLRILAKAVDVSLCQVKSFFAEAMGLLDDRADAVARRELAAVSPLLAVTLLELLSLVLMRHAAALIQPSPLPHCVHHDPVNQDELKLTPTAARDFCKVISALLEADTVPHVRSAALAAAVTVLTAWANAVRFTEEHKLRTTSEEGAAPETPWLQLDDQLALALCGHLGGLLTEANAVPPDCGSFGKIPEPGNLKDTSACSLIFDLIHKALHAGAAEIADERSAPHSLTDSQRVGMAALACTLVTACPHPDVADSNLPAVILTQALSNREDLQGVAWVLLGRLRKDAHAEPDSASAFFKVLMHAVHMVHRDAGVEVASDLSVRLLQHTAVGKLALGMQVALVTALQAGVQTAVSAESSPGFLEALVPWVTKHVVDDALLLELAAWTEAEAGAHVQPEAGTDEAAVAARLDAAGVPAFIEACRATAARGERAAAGAGPPAAAGLALPAAGEPSGKRAAAGGEPEAEAEAEADNEDPALDKVPSQTFAAAPPTPQAASWTAGPGTASQTGSSQRAVSAATPRGVQSKRRRVTSARGFRQPVGPARAFGPQYSQN